MPNSSDSGTLGTSEASAHWLQGIPAIDAADLLLASVLAPGNRSLTLECTPAGLDMLRDGAAASARWTLARDRGFSDAVAARLCLIAGLDVGSAEAQVVITRVRIESSAEPSGPPPTTADVLVACRATAEGLSIELHRMADRDLAGRRAEDERYHLGHELGRGGMGVVYAAQHKALQKTVALKVLRPALSQDPRVAAQFLVEARAACRISDPGVVQVTDFGYLNDGSAFFAMELVAWPTLEVVLSKERTFEPSRAMLVAERIAGVLEAASAQGVVHRDLKPANVFLGPGDEVKLCDFGLAWILDREHARFRQLQSGTTWGTPAYMAPEQARGGATDVRSDIFSLGLVLLRLVLGYLPERVAVEALSTAAAESPVLPDAPRLPQDEIPDAVRRVVRRATAARPQERYQSAAEMRADLQAASRLLARQD